MTDQMNGMIILNAIPDTGVEKKVGEFLSCHAKNIPLDKLKDMIKKTPVVLSKNVSEKIGKTFVSKLEMLGASATYVQKPNLSKQVTPTQQTTFEHASNLRVAQEDPHPEHTNSKASDRLNRGLKDRLFAQFIEVNKELWLILSMIMIIGGMNYLLASQRMLLGLYTLPTLFSAYFFGRRHATLTAVASIFLVGVAIYYNPSWLIETKSTEFMDSKWLEIIPWGGILMITAYTMGTLCDRTKKRWKNLDKLTKAFWSFCVILSQMMNIRKITATEYPSML